MLSKLKLYKIRYKPKCKIKPGGYLVIVRNGYSIASKVSLLKIDR